MWIIMSVFAIIALGIAKSIKSFTFKLLFYFAAGLLIISAFFNAMSDPWFIGGIIVIVGGFVVYLELKRRHKARKAAEKQSHRRTSFIEHRFDD
jgi:Ca2+/Na+ antiporter